MSDDASEDDGDEDDDPDFGSSAKRKPQKPKAPKKGLLIDASPVAEQTKPPRTSHRSGPRLTRRMKIMRRNLTRRSSSSVRAATREGHRHRTQPLTLTGLRGDEELRARSSRTTRPVLITALTVRATTMSCIISRRRALVSTRNGIRPDHSRRQRKRRRDRSCPVPQP